MAAPLPQTPNTAPLPQPPNTYIPKPAEAFMISNIRCGAKKRWLIARLKEHGLIQHKNMTSDGCIFYWRQLSFDNAFVQQISTLPLYKLPIISFIPSQSIICDKVKLSLTLYKYYGDKAWHITPKTLHICFDLETNEWQINDEVTKHILNDTKWITKKNIGYAGQHIFLFRDKSLKALHHFLSTNYTKRMIAQKDVNRFNYISAYEQFIKASKDSLQLLSSLIFQQYIDKPLLYEGNYKFDLRVNVLVATTNPSVLFYKFIKQRICATAFTQNNETKTTHLEAIISNSTQARKHKDFDKKTSTINGRKTLNDYDGFIKYMYHMAINEKQFETQWFETLKYKQKYEENQVTLPDIAYLVDIKICNIITSVYNAAKHSFDEDNKKYNRKCQFLFHGVDILVDEKGKMWLCEVNQRPAITTDHDQNINNICKSVAAEMIDIVFEIRQLKLKGVKVDQYTALKAPKLWKRGYLDYNDSMNENVNSNNLPDESTDYKWN